MSWCTPTLPARTLVRRTPRELYAPTQEIHGIGDDMMASRGMGDKKIKEELEAAFGDGEGMVYNPAFQSAFLEQIGFRPRLHDLPLFHKAAASLMVFKSFGKGLNRLEKEILEACGKPNGFRRVCETLGIDMDDFSLLPSENAVYALRSLWGTLGQYRLQVPGLGA